MAGPSVIETPEGPVPVPYFGPYSPPPLPQIANPLPSLVTGAEERWDTVWNWTKNAWHSVTGFFEGAASVTYNDLVKASEAALSVAQTAWSSMLSTLEIWSVVGIDELGQAVDDVRTAYRSGDIVLGQMIEALSGQVIDGLTNVLKVATTYTDDAVRNVEADILRGEGAIEDWVTTTVTIPLLKEILGAKTDVLDELSRTIANTRTWVEDLVNSKLRDLLAELGIATAAITVLEEWVNDCGAPMCEQMGPGTDFSKLLKLLNIAGMLALLTSIGTLTESELEQLARTIVDIGQGGAASFAKAFVTEGDTLAGAIASTVPQIGF